MTMTEKTGIFVNNDLCSGCGLCVRACPFNAISVDRVTKKAFVNDACPLCGSCVDACKLKAITVIRREAETEYDKSHFSGVWVFAEIKQKATHNTREPAFSPQETPSGATPAAVSFELLGAARTLADSLGTPVSAVVLGVDLNSAAQALAEYGADNVYIVDRPELEHFNDELYADALTQLATRFRPEIILVGATAYGRSLAPKVASRLNSGLTADCTALAIDPDTRNLMQTRPAFGGNLMATIVCPNHRPQMSTVRPKVMKPLERSPGRHAKLINYDIGTVKSPTVKLLESVITLTDAVNLSEADIIVSGGRGLGDSKNFIMLEELAKLLGGAVGASRAAVDAGWIDYSHQVGQTGKTVGPKIYIACGISGSIQHQAGMSSSDIIIAINKNPDAPIFKIATYGIVGDALVVVPEIIKQLKSAH